MLKNIKAKRQSYYFFSGRIEIIPVSSKSVLTVHELSNDKIVIFMRLCTYIKQLKSEL